MPHPKQKKLLFFTPNSNSSRNWPKNNWPRKEKLTKEKIATRCHWTTKELPHQLVHLENYSIFYFIVLLMQHEGMLDMSIFSKRRLSWRYRNSYDMLNCCNSFYLKFLTAFTTTHFYAHKDKHTSLCGKSCWIPVCILSSANFYFLHDKI